MTRLAVVTGASSGIGAATVRRLVADGLAVLAVARRADRLEALAAETGCATLVCDVTSDADVAALAVAAAGASVVVHCAGGALGADAVEAGEVADWQWMWDVNVLGVLRVTKALLPGLEASGDGHVLVLGSTAGRVAYEGGGGYVAAKHAVAALTQTLRLELAGRPVRVSEVAPGMVRTEQFATLRYRGDEAAAAAVYAGVDHPLVAEDVADVVAWVLSRPRHVNVDLVVVRPVAQAAQHKVHRGPIWPAAVELD